jgi:hypothetical protein
MTTRVNGNRLVISHAARTPLPGILMSRRQRSGTVSIAAETAAGPSAASAQT